jgi:anti-sigma regulatory factor (Ser/Thr protein kinase)
VGGDWFDAIAVDDGLVLVVGDVQGHDVQAAALMGQLRTVVRATASEGHPPAGVLARTADYLDRLDSDRIATVLVAHLDVHAHLATTACAGHLPPLIVRPDHVKSIADQIEVAVGPPLGIGEQWDERTTHLPPGAVLLLYTDGLVETRTWDIDEGIALLEALLETLPTGSLPDRVLDTALELLPAGSRGDDVAVLAARVPPDVDVSSRRVQRSLPAQSRSVPLARSWVEGWLAGSEASPEQRDVLLLVVSELVTNAVSQGDGMVRITLESDDSWLLVEVFDSGHRLPSMSNAAPDDTGGRGLHLVEAISDAWGVREELHGKSVWARLRR